MGVSSYCTVPVQHVFSFSEILLVAVNDEARILEIDIPGWYREKQHKISEPIIHWGIRQQVKIYMDSSHQ